MKHQSDHDAADFRNFQSQPCSPVSHSQADKQNLFPHPFHQLIEPFQAEPGLNAQPILENIFNGVLFCCAATLFLTCA